MVGGRGGFTPPAFKMATNAASPREGGREELSLALQELGIMEEIYPYEFGPQRNGMKGIFCKNLFLKDRKGQFYLIIFPEDKVIDLKELKVKVHAHRNFSFSSSEDLLAKLGVPPGAVTPLGLIFDPSGSIRVIIDQSLADDPDSLLNFHPLTPDETMLISFSNLETFIKHTGHSFLVLKLN